MANTENKQIPYESTQKDIRDEIGGVSGALKSTESTSRNVADILAEELSRIAGHNASQVDYDNSTSQLSADNVQDAIDEIVGDIPTALSELSDDSTHRLVTDSEKAEWNATTPTDTTDDEPYVLRQGKGNQVDFSLEGASVAWNQLVDSGTSSVIIPSGHKYIRWNGSTLSKATSDGTAISVTGGTDKIYDITQTFGTTIADSMTTDIFAKYFPKYKTYAYDTGSIQSVCVSERKVVGFNQWDEIVEIGGLNPDTGEETSSDRLRSKNYIPVDSNLNYYVHYTYSNYGIRFLYYDVNKNWIGSSAWTGSGIKNFTNAKYIRFYVEAAYGTTYKNNICINISDVSKNGTYEPYTSTTYPLPTTQLRGLFSLVNGKLKANGDIYSPSGSITRNTELLVLNGSESGWGKNESTGLFYFSLPSRFQLSQIPLISKRFTALEPQSGTSLSTKPSGSLALYSNYGGMNVKDDNYSNVTSFKNSLASDPITLLLKVNTPTTESTNPYQNPQRAYPDGTEEFVDGLTRDVIVPVGNNSTYTTSDVLASADDYTDGMGKMLLPISAVGTDESGRTTASRTYTTGEFFYMDGKMYKALTSIASGATFTVGTNISETTLFAELTALA